MPTNGLPGRNHRNGKLQLTGLQKPNPLGLHDMLGNVDEMMFEPFRLNKLDRQHGQAGGFVVRGGNYLTAQADLRTALRKEDPYYNADGQVKNKTTGLRLVMVSPTHSPRASGSPALRAAGRTRHRQQGSRLGRQGPCSR